MKRYIQSTDEPKYLNEPRVYEIHEVSNKQEDKVYTLMMTGKELKKFLQGKREMYGYIPGCGGDKSYDCWAVEVQGDSY